MIDLDKIRKERPLKELLEFSILNLDKPRGPPSFSITKYVRDTLKVRKASHLGTLDPAVTGVLPISLNRACRLNEYLMHRNKVYVGIMRLHQDVETKKVEKAMQSFVGMIRQLPPKRSRVKRAERVREVKSFELFEKDGQDVLFLADVQAGTYIRRLCDDVGKALGCGAHMLELRRTKASIFEEAQSRRMYEYDKAIEALQEGDEKPLRSMIIPGEVISTVLPVLVLKPDVEKSIRLGSPIFVKYIESNPPVDLKPGDKVCAFLNDRFAGCYRTVLGKDIYAVPEFVYT